MYHLGTKSRRRTRVVTVRMSEPELAVLHAGAEAAGITLADLVRRSACDTARHLMRDAERPSFIAAADRVFDAEVDRRSAAAGLLKREDR
jgi:uncharacterized protein (DUF1778 family)